MEDKRKDDKKLVPAGNKQGRVCMVCGKPSPTTICSQCEAKIRGEALEHKQEIEKAGRTDTGRR
ncbi:MAG: hypothetical protein HZC45_07700 [Deltaproteobacteria bacterium]|nr:hypothetical protein [Deltaproteobacteria bacterium]